MWTVIAAVAALLPAELLAPALLAAELLAAELLCFELAVLLLEMLLVLEAGDELSSELPPPPQAPSATLNISPANSVEILFICMLLFSFWFDDRAACRARSSMIEVAFFLGFSGKLFI